MAQEIERKFLVRDDGWRDHATTSIFLRQGYLLFMDGRSVRVRTYDNSSAKLTLKISKTVLTRDEFEYDIPIEDARELLNSVVGLVLEKTRYCVTYQGYIWEIDVFAGVYEGLLLAEVEMKSEADTPALPDWLGEEVTGDKRYSNHALATDFDSGAML